MNICVVVVVAVDEDNDKKLFPKILHSLQIVFVGIVDRLVDLTSHTYFAKLLQVIFNQYIIISFIYLSLLATSTQS